jgi:hypothetical protein
MNTIGDSTIIITTREDIMNIVNDAVRMAITPLIPQKKEEPERFNINGAVTYLQEKGIRISKSALYKVTPNGGIPVHRFGSRLVFDCHELEEWANFKLKNANTNKIAHAVAKSIKRKN